MELRSDIATAAARMTSGHDVSREIRRLDAYLRDGETVARMTSGVYGTGTGLLAVTNHRVLLLRDGRSGQASEGYPVERLSGADWTVDGITGTITITDANSVAELRDVPLADGADVVAVLRGFIARNAPRQLFGEERTGLESGGFGTQAGGDPAGIPGQTRFPVHVTAGTAQQLSGLAAQGGYPAQPPSGSFPAQQPAAGGFPGQPHGGFPAQQGQPGGEQSWSGAWPQQTGGFSSQSNSDGFLAQPRSDAFGTQQQSDPFGAQQQHDPFGAQAQNDPLGTQAQNDPLGAQAQNDPLGTQAQNDPLGARRNSDPFGVQAPNDPFGARQKSDPFGAQAPNDPFGAQAQSGEFPAQQPVSGGFPAQQPASGSFAAQQPANGSFAAQQPGSGNFPAQQPTGGSFAAQQPASGSFPAQAPAGGGFPAQQPTGGSFAAQQPASGGFPAQQSTSGGFPTQQPASGSFPAQQPTSGSFPAQQPANGSSAAQQPASGSFPAQQPGSGNFPAQQPASGGFPAQQPANGSSAAQQPASGNFPAQQPASGSFPAQQPASGGFPAQQPQSGGFPAQQPRFPGQQGPAGGGQPRGGYPAQQSGFPTQASTVGIPQAQGSAVFPVPAQSGGVEGLEQRVAAFGSAEALTAAAVPVTMLAESGSNQPQPVVLAPSAAPLPGAPLPPSAVSADAIGSPTAIAGEVPVSQLVTQRTEEPELEDAADADAADRPKPISWRMPPAEAAGKGSAKEGTSTDKATEQSTALLAASGTGKAKDEDKAGNVTPLRPASKPTGRSPKKWIWLGAGAAGLIGLAAIGSAKLISTNSQPVAAPVSPAPAASVDQPVGTAATVTKVIDGETVEVAGPGVTGPVVVLGIVAPKADKNQCGATAAKAYAVKTLNNAQVTLVADASQAATDKSGRKQAFVRLADGGDYSEMAVRAGMARYYESPQPVARAAEIKAAEEEAKSNKAGFWGAPCNGKVGGTGTANSSRASTGGTQPPARTVSNVQESPR